MLSVYESGPQEPRARYLAQFGRLIACKHATQGVSLEPNGTKSSNNCVLAYVLRHSGVRECLTSGKIEFDEGKGLRVYSAFGTLNEYILGVRDEELERF